MEKIEVADLKRFDSEWDEFDLPNRKVCIRNLEALLCQKVRAGEDESQVIKALSYFQSVESSPSKLDNTNHNIAKRIYKTVTESTRDILAVLGALVIVTALCHDASNSRFNESQAVTGVEKPALSRQSQR